MSLSSYLRETKAELTHVKWPSRQATVNFTLVVIGISVVCGILLGAFDFIFTSVVKLFI